MFFVYALESQKDGRIYVGFTGDVNKRVKEHNSGKTKSTKGYLPWHVFYVEKCLDRKEARKKEIYLKRGSGKEYLKRILTSFEGNIIYGPIVQRIE